MKLVLSAALLMLPALGAAPVAARTTIRPYIEAQQVFSADISGHDQDAVTYTGLAAGVDATLDGAHVHGQIDYRYDRYFSWSRNFPDGDTHQGMGTVTYQPNENLSFDIAGIAQRSSSGFGRHAGFVFGDTRNTQQIYAAQAGPSYTNHFGDVGFNAAYRLGWTKADRGNSTLDLGPGQPVLKDDFTTIDQIAGGSVGTTAGGLGLPFGWKLSGGWTSDQVHFLHARMDGYFARADITQPVSDTVAIEGGVGWARNRASNEQILLDAAGNAVLDDHRQLQADKSKKRLLSYDQDGLIWDVGVLWRPSSRTTLEIHGGKRWGETVVYGRFDHQIDPSSTITVVAYDDVTSYGRQLTGGIGALPDSFNSFQPQFASTLGSCVFGANGGSGTCLPGVALVNPNFYRSRGVWANWSSTRGLWTYGFGVIYDNRHYLGTDFGTTAFSSQFADSQNVLINASALRKLSPVSSVIFDAQAGWYDSKAFEGSSYWVYGASASYYRDFSRHLSGSASLAVSSGSGDGFSSDVIGSGLISIRYTM